MPTLRKYEAQILGYAPTVECDKDFVAWRLLMQQVGDAIGGISEKRRLAQFEVFVKGDRFILLGRN